MDARHCTEHHDVFAIGEAPGPEEHKVGYPFVGPSGKLLRLFLGRAHIYERTVLTNVARRWPHEGRKTVKPSDEMVENGMPFLMGEINTLKPKVLIAVGDTAAKQLGGKGTVGEMSNNPWEWQGITTVCIFHPSYLIRNPPDARYRDVELRTKNTLDWVR